MDNYSPAASIVSTALNLPAPEVEALWQGRMIVANSRTFIAPGRIFALRPTELAISFPIDKVYCANFLSTAKVSLEDFTSRPVAIKAWAKCEFCQILDTSTPLDALSNLTVWTVEALEEFLSRQQRIFLTYLRVYRLPQQVGCSAYSRGQFANLPNSLAADEAAPVLESYIFNQRKQQLIELEPPVHPELEELLIAIAESTTLHQLIKLFLGLSSTVSASPVDPDMSWIKTIADVGNSGDGNLFEKLVRRSFVKLGFSNSGSNLQASLNPDGCGGAGGLDFYCENPYPIVGECKATKSESVPSGTPSQLVTLGLKHLQEQYESCIKIIMAAGKMTNHANQIAIGNKMNIIRPETLQRLVELVSKHNGSVDLLTLKPCLEEAPFGEEADDKVNQYIDSIWKNIKLRANLIQVVKKLTKPEEKHLEVTKICDFYNFEYVGIDHQSSWLGSERVYHLLIELSSPLTGYLGRKIGLGDLRTDRFYYLRDLVVDE